MFDPLPDDVAGALVRHRERLGAFDRVRYLAVAGSTNDVALTLADAGEPSGTSVIAGEQRQGRGRRGNEWFSPADAGLYLSVILRLPRAAPVLPLVTLGAGAAAARAIKAVTGLTLELKWPNDVVIGRPWRKLGGVLCEAPGREGRAGVVIVGIGLNVLGASYPPELATRATSIEIELGRSVDRGLLAVELLAGLRDVEDLVAAGRAETVRAWWREFGQAAVEGAAVAWHDGVAGRHGRARDIDHDGALLVEADGRVERLVGGQVRWMER